MADANFEHVWKAPARGARILLLLHGTGGDEHDLLQLATMLDPDAGVLSPRGKVLEQGMPRWFRRLAPGVFDIDDLRRRAEELAAFVAASAARYGFAAGAVTAIGFSNGANIAAAMMLLGYPAPRDAVLLRAMVPLEPEPLPDLTGRAALVAAGRTDQMTPPDQPGRLADLLARAGAAVDTHWSHAGHELVKADLDAAALFLAKRVD